MHVQHKRRHYGVYTLELLTETFLCLALLYGIRSWRRKGYDKKRRQIDRLQDLGEQRRLGVGGQVRLALGKKRDRTKTRLTQCYWESCQGTELH